MPSGIDESVGELVVAIDTSGSIGGKELGQFLGEVKAICDTVKPERVRVLYWDTQVCGEEVYEQDELDRLITSTKPKGGGGTDVTCVGKHIRDTGIKSQAAIVLTDGYLGNDWGDWSIPVLWCIVGNRSATPSVGSYVHVDD
jgi:predicted metal-dependent peptidase